MIVVAFDAITCHVVSIVVVRQQLLAIIGKEPP